MPALPPAVGYLRGLLGRRMLTACEVSVEFWLALSQSPLAHWLQVHKPETCLFICLGAGGSGIRWQLCPAPALACQWAATPMWFAQNTHHIGKHVAPLAALAGYPPSMQALLYMHPYPPPPPPTTPHTHQPS